MIKIKKGIGKKDVYDFLEKYNVPLTECYIDYKDNCICWEKVFGLYKNMIKNGLYNSFYNEFGIRERDYILFYDNILNRKFLVEEKTLKFELVDDLYRPLIVVNFFDLLTNKIISTNGTGLFIFKIVTGDMIVKDLFELVKKG